jgi:hypothetical protein
MTDRPDIERLRERLATALAQAEVGHDGGCASPFSRCEVDWLAKADRLIAALGDDAARLAAAPYPKRCGCRVVSSLPDTCPSCGHREHSHVGCGVML